MFPGAAAIRPEERRSAWSAFGLLLLLMTAHALLETARDALFLGSIDASRLPWVYLLVAGASFGVLEVQRRWNRRSNGSLGFTLTTAALLTTGLWMVLPRLGDPGLYALYVLSSVTITLVLVQFWLAMGRAFDARQAKRLYAFIGTGSVLGAIAGFGVAGALAQVVPARQLVGAAAVALFCAAGLALMVGGGEGEDSDSLGLPVVRAATISEAMSRPYVRLLAATLLTSTLALTVGDFLFKAAVAQNVPSEDLASTFALLYLGLNVLSLGVQVLLVNRVIGSIGVVRGMLVLPAAMLFGTVGLAAGLGMGAAIALKSADGGLRHTLHRTVSELLYVPMPERIRARVKGLLDVFGQRGGQALASVLILLALAVGATPALLAGGLVVLLVAWIGLGVALQTPYVDVFRRTLDDVILDTNLEFPHLDMASLEGVLRSLNSANDREVLAALAILERAGKCQLVPALLLYHPSDAVVVRALDLFMKSGDELFLPVARRIQGRATPAVHAAVVRATMAVDPDPDVLFALTESHCRATRTTATAYLLSSGQLSVPDAEAALRDLLNHENGTTAALAIVNAAPWTATPTIEQYVGDFLHHPDSEVRERAIAAASEIRSQALLGPLIGALGDRPLRHLTRQALLTYGGPGLEALREALANPDTSEVVRWEVPRVITGFGGPEALAILQHTLTRSGGMVQYRVIRALEALVQGDDVALRVDARVLEEASLTTLGVIYRMMAQRIRLSELVVERTDTQAHRYLIRLFRDKEAHAIERVIRLVGIGAPSEDFARILRGLKSADSAVRSSSLELLELSTPVRYRSQLLALVDGGDDARRLQSAGPLRADVATTYEAVLSDLIMSRSESIRALAIAQVGAIGLTELRPLLTTLPHTPSTMLGDVLSRVLSQLVDPARPQEA